MRRADIQAGPACGAYPKVFERAFQLKATSADVFLVTTNDFDFCISGKCSASLVRTLSVHLHFACKNQSSSSLGRLGKAAFHEKQVETLANWLWLHKRPEG